MPHHPSEENAPEHIFDQVAKESDNSTASDHPNHDEKKGAVKATAADHQSKGPQIVESRQAHPSNRHTLTKQACPKQKTRRLSGRRRRS
jgi:hypothetical protein